MKRLSWPVLVSILVAAWTLYLSHRPAPTDYDPAIDPASFVSHINNKFFSLKPGQTYIYHNQTPEGLEVIKTEVTQQTRPVIGVTTMVVRDRAWLNGRLQEDTRDYYAQDKAGNVWYFGEAVDNFENGKLKDHAGSWEAGVNGAKPGIIMEANPLPGDTYRQEFFPGTAEDQADVVSLEESVQVPYKNYRHCLETRDYSPLDPGINEYKYYCAGGVLALEREMADGQVLRSELVKVLE